MAFDHSLHAYAGTWAPFWFFRDFDRSPFLDALYLFDQSIIMPMLFFIFGMFVIPALQRNGFVKYYKQRLIKLGIPFLIGVPCVVPLLTYPKFHEYTDPNPSYWEYWSQIFFSDKLQAGPFWVLYAILLFTTILIIIYKVLPGVVRMMARFVQYISTHPVIGIISFMVLSAIVYGVSDLIWGAPWWIGFWKLFYLQGARFIMNFIYFMMGAGLMASGLMDNKAFWERFSSKTFIFGALMLLVGAAYSTYSMMYFQHGAYASDEVRHLLASGATYSEAWPLFSEIAPWVLTRTTLLGMLTALQVLFLLSFFYRYLNQPTPIWQSLAKNGYGIFLFHESMVVWLQFALLGFALSPYVKTLIVFVLGLGGAWILNDRLRRLPGFRAVLN
jgi:hypothetical protein